MLDYSWNADFKPCESIIEKICLSVLNQSKQILILNVNFPTKTKKFKGIKVCRQAKGYWEDTYDKRISPLGKEYYWLTGSFINQDNDKETDEWALENGFVSVVPITYDMTNRCDHRNLKNIYYENGSIYIFKPEILKKYNNRLGGKISVYIMESWQKADIDDQDSFDHCLLQFKKYNPVIFGEKT